MKVEHISKRDKKEDSRVPQKQARQMQEPKGDMRVRLPHDRKEKQNVAIGAETQRSLCKR